MAARVLRLAWLLSATLVGFGGSVAAAATVQPPMTGLHVSGNHIVNGAGQVVRLLGADRMSTEYACIQGWGFSYGALDETSVQAMATWDISAVRIPLNEDCWLGINNAPAQYSGSNYQQAIANYISLLNKYNIAAIIDLHWNAPGSIPSQNQQPMADADHAPTFWTSVANTFKGNTSVVFDLYNEPYPDNNQDTTAAWNCLLSGCQQGYYVDANGNNVRYTWQAAGMNQLISAVRSTGATNLIITAGVGWSGLMTQWLQYVPTDPQHNLAASTHIYPGGWCATSTCWNNVLAPITAQYPLLVGEMGETDCAHTFIDSLMGWLDQQGGQNYLAWTWVPTSAVPCTSYALIQDFTTGAPSGYGLGLYDHLTGLYGSPPTPTPTSTPSAVATSTPTSTATAPPSFTLTGRPSPTALAPGGTETLNASVTSATAMKVLVDIEVHDASGAKIAQQTYSNQTFAAGQTQQYAPTWNIPSTQGSGTYTEEIGIFSTDWATLYAWDSNAGQFSVASALATATPTSTATSTPTPTSTPVETGYWASATVTPTTVAPGASLSLGVSAHSPTGGSLLVQVEIDDPAGMTVYQKHYKNQSFGAGQTLTYSTTWKVPSRATPGLYTVKISLFTSGSGALDYSNDQAAQFTVS